MSTVRSTGRAVGKRALAAFICLTMLCGLIPAAVLSTKSADVATYVSLPITIRDYAADGMLFEWNELGTVGDTTYINAPKPNLLIKTQAGGGAFTPSSFEGGIRYTSTSSGIYITYTIDSIMTRSKLRYCVVKYRTNAQNKDGTTPVIGHRWSGGGTSNYVAFDTSGYNKTGDFDKESSWATVVIDLGSGDDNVNYVTLKPKLDANNFIDISYVAFFNEKTDAETYISNGGIASASAKYHNGNTRGFGLLDTDSKDHFNDLVKTESVIIGSDYFENGTWGVSTQPKSVEAELNSGARQAVYGALLRTNLVEAELDANKRPVYTESAVTYIANLLQKTLPEVWQNADGSYNMWYVMGHELSELGDTDLATKLRA